MSPTSQHLTLSAKFMLPIINEGFNLITFQTLVRHMSSSLQAGTLFIHSFVT